MDIISMDAGKLDLLAKRIRNDLDLREESRADWIKATLDLSAALVEARECFASDTTFGQWWKGCGFGISRDDREAFIAFGREPERARLVLEKTKSSSVRLIHEKEFRFRNAAEAKNTKPKTQTTAPKLQKALDTYDEFKAAGVEPTQGQLMDKAGVSATIAQKAVERRLTEAELARQEPDLSDFSKSAKEKVEAAVRKIQKHIESEWDMRLQAAVRKQMAEIIMPMYAEKLAVADRVMAVNKKPFTIEEFRKLLAALHPDSSSVEKRTEMFMIVKQREYLLRPAEKDRPLSGDLPKTIEELLARRRKK